MAAVIGESMLPTPKKEIWYFDSITVLGTDIELHDYQTISGTINLSDTDPNL